MTEVVWLESPRLFQLLRCLPDDPEPSARKQRLFGVACCRHAAEWVQHPDIPSLIDLCERAADDPILGSRLHEHAERVRRRVSPPEWGTEVEGLPWLLGALAAVLDEPGEVLRVTSSCRVAVVGQEYDDYGDESDPFHADLFRDIFGNPFRPVEFAPSWRTSSAVGVARSMYESRDFSPMPILADALEEVGCDSPDVLAHCRDDGRHVRGCWVVDLVLGKA